MMGINVTIDEALIAEARKTTGLSDDTAAIEAVIRSFLAQRAAREKNSLSRYAGQFEFTEDYDVLKERGARGLSG